MKKMPIREHLIDIHSDKLQWSKHRECAGFLQTVSGAAAGPLPSHGALVDTIGTTTGVRKPVKLQTDGWGGSVELSWSGHGMRSGQR